MAKMRMIGWKTILVAVNRRDETAGRNGMRFELGLGN